MHLTSMFYGLKVKHQRNRITNYSFHYDINIKLYNL